MGQRTWKIDPRWNEKLGKFIWPTPRKELRRILRQRYGNKVQLVGCDGSVIFVDENGQHIEGTPCTQMRRMLQGDMEYLLSEVARVVPFTATEEGK